MKLSEKNPNAVKSASELVKRENMLKKLWLNLQLFGDGGDGGDGSPASATGEQGVANTGESIPASIPEKAKKYYQKA